jgi:hypothetical protein
MTIGKNIGNRLKTCVTNAGKWPQKKAMVAADLTFPAYAQRQAQGALQAR